MSNDSTLSYLQYMKESGINDFLQNSPNKFYGKKIIKKNITKNITQKKINDINSLDDLKNFILTSESCKLKKLSKSTVFSDGNSTSKIMLIGEAPGAEEDKLGKPFVGQAGQLLNKMLLAINLNRNSVYITNIIPWRPPNNRTPTSEEIIQCLPFVQKHIEIISPKIIVLLGATATKAILATPLGITKLRGKWYNYNSPNIEKSILTLATYHPAFLLRSPSFKKEAWEDLKKIQEKIKEEL